MIAAREWSLGRIVFWTEAIVGGLGFLLTLTGLAFGAGTHVSISTPRALLGEGMQGLLGDGLWLLVLAPAAAVAAGAVWGFATRRARTALLALLALCAILIALFLRV